MKFYCVFTLLAFLATFFYHEIQSFEITLEHVLPNIFNNGASECLIFLTSHVHIKLGVQNQQLYLDTNNTAGGMKFKYYLPKVAKCVVSFATHNDFEVMQDVTLAVDNHITVYLAMEPPNQLMLMKIRRPLLWIQRGKSEKVVYLFNVYCAKMGKPKISKPIFAGTCSQKCCDASCFPAKVEDICSNPLKGQTITMAEPMTFPNFLPPQMFNTGGKMSGELFNLFKLASYVYDFEFKLDFNVDGGDFIPENLTYTPGKFHDVQIGNAEVTQAALLEVFHILFDLIVPYYESNLVYVTRAPMPITSLGNITRQFSDTVWILSLATIFVLATMLHIIHKIYNIYPMKAYGLAKEERLKGNLWIFPFAKITEPDPLPWFNKWSTGKIVVLIWSILSTFLTHFYTSNFRASLIAVKYEKPPTTLRDVLERGARVYNFELAVFLRREYLEAIGQSGSVKHKIAILSEQSGGLYSFTTTGGGLPEGTPKDMLTNGAFALMEDLTIPYLYAVYPDLVREAIYLVDEPADSFFKCVAVQKHSPGTKILNTFTRKINQFGLPLKWSFDHLPMRSVVKPKPPQAQLKAMDLKNYYMMGLMYSVMIAIASASFFVEIFSSCHAKLRRDVPHI